MTIPVLILAALLLLAVPLILASRKRHRDPVVTVQVSKWREHPTHVYMLRRSHAGRECEVTPIYDATPASLTRLDRVTRRMELRHERRDDDGYCVVYNRR